MLGNTPQHPTIYHTYSSATGNFKHNWSHNLCKCSLFFHNFTLTGGETNEFVHCLRSCNVCFINADTVGCDRPKSSLMQKDTVKTLWREHILSFVCCTSPIEKWFTFAEMVISSRPSINISPLTECTCGSVPESGEDTQKIVLTKDRTGFRSRTKHASLSEEERHLIPRCYIQRVKVAIALVSLVLLFMYIVSI